MKLRQKISISAIAMAVGFAGFFGTAFASTPSLTVGQPDGNNIVRITVSNADPFSTVGLYQQQGSGQLIFISNYGQTDGSGFFTQLATLSTDGTNNAIQEYVIINGFRSNTVTVFPNGFNNGGNFGNISLSQNNLVLNSGQSASVTVSSSAFPYNSFFISNSSNTSVATAQVSGNTITVFGNSSGSAVFTVSQINNSQTASLFVTVNGGSNFGNITFSNSNPTLSAGQSMSISIFSNNGLNNSFYVSSNSNSNVVSANVSGNVLNLQGLNNGSATVSICQINNSQCANVFVTVSGFNTGNNAITFSTSNLFMNVGQTTSVSVLSNNFNNSSFYVNSNSNNNVVTATISGNTLNLNAIGNGSATITVCQFNTNACGNLSVNVGGSGFGNFTLSQNSISLNIGQTATVTAVNPNAGFNSFVISSNSNPNVVSASVAGNVISLYGLNNGSSTLSVCQNTGNFQCQSLFVNVNNSFNNSGINFSPANPILNIGQTTNVFISSNAGFSNQGFYVSSNSNPGVASANISGSSMFIQGLNAGSASISVCQYNNFNQCGTVFVTVNNSGTVLGASLYNNGTLINDNGTIYITYKNTKTGFANAAAFAGLGYSFKNVISASTSQLTPSSFVIASQFIPHPWGTWILSGGTIYFSHQTGLIPVGDWNVFVNNGGNSALVVTANSFDLQRPILPVMVSNDSRLK